MIKITKAIILTSILLFTTVNAADNELPLCDVKPNQDDVINIEDRKRLHNCRTKRFPISRQNGFKNDLGFYTGSWKNGQREGRGTTTDWLSFGITTNWKNDSPTNGLAFMRSCMTQTNGYVLNGRFISFTQPLSWLATLIENLEITWLAEAISALESTIQFVISEVLND
jgi:hypothetical protein